MIETTGNKPEKKPWRVVKYESSMDRYVIDWYKNGVRQCTFGAKRDDRRGMFYLALQVRYPYREVPTRKTVYFDECTWEI